MATAAERITELETLVRYLEMREKVHTTEMEHFREIGRQQRAEQTKLSDESAKHRDEFARFREQVATDFGKHATTAAAHQADIGELKKSREHWSARVWQIAAGLLLAAAGGVIGYLLKK